MAAQLEIGGYIVEFDREATIAAYSTFAMAQPEECGCWYCRNWVMGREQMLPTAVRELLARLGVPIWGEIEVWEVPGDEQPHLYCGWYMVVGRVIACPADGSREFPLGGWRLSWKAEPSYKMPQFADHEVCELHFMTAVGDYIAPEIAAGRSQAPTGNITP